MLNLLSIVVIGFFLGMRHATDPDHVIAVSTIVTRQNSTGRAALIGMLWGVGHTATIFAVGTAIILFNIVIPSRLGLSMELCVGLMLILLGGWNLWEVFRTAAQTSESIPRPIFHFETHNYGDYFHTHSYWESPNLRAHSPQRAPVWRLDRSLSKVGRYRFLRPLIVGIVHGLAGSAAIALLILASIRNPVWSIAYLVIFGIGTIMGMMLITLSIASTLRYAGSRFRQFNRNLAMASGLISVAFGMFLAFQICVTQGLFSAHPHWSPR
jgi:ABC-type nickel/cobalt efflux system permease component RcnA